MRMKCCLQVPVVFQSSSVREARFNSPAFIPQCSVPCAATSVNHPFSSRSPLSTTFARQNLLHVPRGAVIHPANLQSPKQILAHGQEN